MSARVIHAAAAAAAASSTASASSSSSSPFPQNREAVLGGIAIAALVLLVALRFVLRRIRTEVCKLQILQLETGGAEEDADGYDDNGDDVGGSGFSALGGAQDSVRRR